MSRVTSSWTPDTPRLGLALLVATFALEVADQVREAFKPVHRAQEIGVTECMDLCWQQGGHMSAWGGTSCACKLDEKSRCEVPP